MQRLLIFLGFMAIGTWLIYLVAVRGEDPEQAAQDFRGKPNLMVMSGVHHQETRNGILAMDLKATQATVDEASAKTLMDQVTFTLYEEGNKGEARISLMGKAGVAMMSQKQETVELTGDVDLLDNRGRRIFSDRVIYSGKEDRLVSPGPVRIVSPQGVQEGRSMEYRIKRKRMVLTEPRMYK